MKNKIIKCNGFQIANNKPLTLIAGPCQLESESHALKMVEKIFRISKKLKINFVYKTSFDKANRTSINGKRGLGLKNSLKIFEKIKKNFNIPILTDVHTSDQCSELSEVVDVLQIPAFLCRQTDLLISAGKTKKLLMLKRVSSLHLGI